MANTIQIKRSSTALDIPTAGQLVEGELAINTTDRKLYSEDSGGTVFEVGGMNGMPPTTISASQNMLKAEIGHLLHKSSGVAVTLTCAQDTNTWDGATWAVHNDDTEDLTIAAGASVTVYWLVAGSAPAAGSVTVKQGGIVTVYKRSNTEFWVWGSKDTTTSVPTTITVADESTDTTCFPLFAISATGDIAPKTGTNLTFNSSTGNLSATLIAGIANANLLDKSVTETVTGQWIFSAAAITLPANIWVPEDSVAATDSAGYGQFWVKNNAPGDPYFTGDTGVDYPLAYATYRRSSANVIDHINQTLNMTTDSVADAMVGAAWIKTNTTAYTLTVEPSTDTQFPVGSQVAIYNRGASGVMTVTEGTGTTLYVLDGSSSTDAAGSATIAAGGYATLIRESTTIYVLMGAGVTP